MMDDMENQHDDDKDYEENEEESFAALFEAYEAGMSDDLKVGDKISGKIISIGSGNVFVDTGTKVDGVVEKAELTDKNGDFTHAEGDVLELYVVAMNESEIHLSKAMSGIGGLNMLKDALENKVPVEGNVKETIKGGFHVEVMKHRAFCPISQMDVRYVEDPEIYVGTTHRFLIKRIESKGRHANIVVSRRDILAKEQQAAHAEFLSKLAPDAIVDGKVTRLMPYGAFVELTPGLEGMVHISELSWSRLATPEDAVKKGDRLKVKILKIEAGPKPNEKRIALSAKQAAGDPWITVADEYHAGDRIKGKVTRLMDFGAFVEIAPGVEGLVHISEMSYVKRINKPDEVVSPQDQVWVVVKAIDTANRRISLSIKDAEGDPWAEVAEKYTVGQAIEGTFEKKEKFGYFICLEPGVVGLMPKSKAELSASVKVFDTMKKGDPITVIIDEIKTDVRRISLAATDTTDEGNWENFSSDKKSTLGSLGEKLQQVLKDNNK
ncbi:MAG: 30S ribosomal protein S1 [Desulfobacteraceae bacterium]|nr:30S ribosomal protein S1 [Desulfobacteraceae bacterium]